MKPKKVHSGPVKDFFIDTITKDVSLVDCILDLLDNCLDGAMRMNGIKLTENRTGDKSYNGFHARISFDVNLFSIEDNCGGIPLNYAIDYAFHFGRRADAPKDFEGLIGLYGIGMKRAIFKMGRTIAIATSTDNIAYRVPIDVSEWQKNDDWDFDIEPSEKFTPYGTKIIIKDLRPQVKEEFSLETFESELVRITARDYSFFLQKGFELTVNSNQVTPYNFSLREGKQFKPIYIKYADSIETDVNIDIKAGMADIPPDDDSAEGTQNLREVDYYGWFVSCNDRIVLAGDKTYLTVWGDDSFPIWHPQYNGFMGIINFQCTDPSKLPWTTTKRNLDESSELYRRAVTKMKDATRPYLSYTNARKANLDEAKEMEETASPKALNLLEPSEKMLVPTFTKKDISFTGIHYQKPTETVKKVKESLGDQYMTNKDVGIQTFDYYVENELEEK